MRQYAATDVCRMVFLTRLLDDASVEPCGVCDVCSRAAVPGAARQRRRRRGAALPSPRLHRDRAAEEAARRGPARASCASSPDGRCACGATRVGAGSSPPGSSAGRVRRPARRSARRSRRRSGSPKPSPTWITFVPSLRQPALVADLAQRLGDALDLPVHEVVVKVRDSAAAEGACRTAPTSSTTSRDSFEVSGPCRRARCSSSTTSSTPMDAHRGRPAAPRQRRRGRLPGRARLDDGPRHLTRKSAVVGDDVDDHVGPVDAGEDVDPAVGRTTRVIVVFARI